ncbi:MAG: cob(I)yrinic acid a,c-diamide adenosyltransferase [Butyrivibrio sp.]|nr:cob(I)yrinic acid a,c-diamide adenosyltransferase [Butyrivibrio sp.]
MSSIGLVHLYTGDGKGKTTAAIGLAIRAAGSGKKVVFTQFMKGQDTSELRSLSLIDNIKVIRNKENLGWFKKGDPELAMAFTGLHNETLDKIKKLIETHECDVLIMDEITYPYNYSIIDKNALEKLIVEKPKYLEIILTGRNADSFFTENSDYITEMKKIKHPYDKGIMAREGIEF